MHAGNGAKGPRVPRDGRCEHVDWNVGCGKCGVEIGACGYV